MGLLQGKTALVTGGNSGIGLATAVRMSAEGAHVFITGRRKAELDAAVELIGPETSTALEGDVSNLDDLDRWYEAISAQGKNLDVLFANAAVGQLASLDQITEADFDQHFGINVRGLLFTVQKALPVLNDGASIILNGSTNADSGAAAFGLYAATKAAVRSFARTWANELKDRRIRVNTIIPGPTETAGLNGNQPTEEKAAEFRGFLSTQVPMGRLADPAEIAAAVLFLASDQSSFITGSGLYADGGLNQI